MAQPQNRGNLMLFWLLIVIGAIVLLAGAWTLFRGLSCEHWPSTEGIVETSQVHDSNSGRHGRTYSAHIIYSYHVGGTGYIGDRLCFGSMSSSSSYAGGIVNRYPVGKKVSVYYSPNDPQLAALEPGPHGGVAICFGVGTVFILFGMMMRGILKSPEAQAALASGQRSIPMNQPPALMGVIFIVMGSFVFFMPTETRATAWVPYSAGAMFVLAGLAMLAWRLQNKIFAKLLIGAALLAFLAVWHWVAFAPGQRLGTATTPFSRKVGVDVKTPFAVFAIIFDAFLLLGVVRWIIKKMSPEDPPTR